MNKKIMSFFIILLSQTSFCSQGGNKYLKLSKFQIATGRKIGQKNKEKYFTKEQIMEGITERIKKMMLRNQKKIAEKRRKVIINGETSVKSRKSPSIKRPSGHEISQNQRKIRAYLEVEKSDDFDQIREQIMQQFKPMKQKQDVFAPGQFDFKIPKMNGMNFEDDFFKEVQFHHHQSSKMDPFMQFGGNQPYQVITTTRNIPFSQMKQMQPQEIIANRRPNDVTNFNKANYITNFNRPNMEINGQKINPTNRERQVKPNNYQPLNGNQNANARPNINQKKPSKSLPNDSDDFETQANKYALKFLNDFRQQNGLQPVEWDEVVFKATRPHTVNQLKLGKISHDGFDNRADQIGRFFFVRQSAENVAYFSDYSNKTPEMVARKLTDQWINSAGHRRNMLLPNITHAAISILKKGSGQVYYYGTQFFVRK